MANPLAAVLDRMTTPDMKIPPDVESRVKRGKDKKDSGSSRRRECLEFWRGNHYVYRTTNNVLTQQAVTTSLDGGGKPRHRVRTTRNLLIDIVAHEVAAATQRIPSYEVNPSTTDPEDVSASRLAGKVARYGFDKWNIRQITEEVVTYGVVTDGGFAWPFFDNSVGPYMTDLEGNLVGQGEINIRVFGPNECYWEPGLRFEESPWHVVEQARDISAVMAQEGYIGGKLDPDADSGEGPQTNRKGGKLVLVTEYLERPCTKYPDGRWLTIANGKPILQPRAFPCRDNDGNVVDEPVLHKLSYITDPDSDRDMGLVEHLLDAQRTYNDCTNKQLEWKNLALNPQVIIQNGEFKERLTDEPGAVYHAIGTGQVLWRDVPAIPQELSQIKEEARTDMARIAAQNDIPSQVAAAAGIQALLEKDQNRRAAFIANLAEFHSRLMRHCLYLVQRHYTEPRLLKIRGRFGPELLPDFLGASLRGQADVTVMPGSIEPRTRASIETRVMGYADRGWVSPEAAMAAINGGTAESLVESYELDVSRANEMVQSIRDQSFLTMPPRQLFTGEEFIDPMTAMPAFQAPGWLPRPFDNISVHKAVISDWMKTVEYSAADPAVQEAANLYYDACLRIEAQQQAQEAAAQEAMAQGLGMANAARPQGASPMPDQPSVNGGGI